MLRKIIIVCLLISANYFADSPANSDVGGNFDGNNFSQNEKSDRVKCSYADSLVSIRKNPFMDRLSIFVKWGIKLDDFHKYQIQHSHYFGIQFNHLMDRNWGLQLEIDYWKADYEHYNIIGEVTSLSYIFSLYVDFSGDIFFTRASVGFGGHRMNFRSMYGDELESLASLDFGFNLGYKLSKRTNLILFLKQQIASKISISFGGSNSYYTTPTFIGLGFGYRF